MIKNHRKWLGERHRFQCVEISANHQRGLTMVELLVALTISLLIALAAIAALTVARRGITTVDAASQLRDNGRFAADLIQRLGVQSGFQDVTYAAGPVSSTDIVPSITGFNNAESTLSTSNSDPLTAFTARASGSLGDGSDILTLRSQLVQRQRNDTTADGSMIDCMGNTLTTGAAPTAVDDRMTSVLSIAESPQGSGELALMCGTRKSDGSVTNRQPIVQGVETFQVLYGTEGVTAGAAPPITYGITAGAPPPAALTLFTPTPPTTADLTALDNWKAAWAAWAASINQAPDRYFRADELTVAGDAASTNANWRRIRSLRIGMVLRGPPHSAQNAVAQTLYPFGLGESSAGVAGAALSSADDIGTIFSAPADGRLRQVVTFTVHLRNRQGL